MIRAAIVGGTGYTGVELLRILAQHPKVEISAVTSRADADKPVDAIYPSLKGRCDLNFTQPEIKNLLESDVVFFATPNGTAMQMAKTLLDNNIKVIDLSADFRIKDPQLWSQWYGMEHACPDLIQEAVYGLPEINRKAIQNSQLIACPGCYPTAVQLGFLPLVEKQLADLSQLIADVKSGVSGAGRKAQVSSLMSESGESFKAYGASGHRHLPEIVQGLESQTDQSVGLTFVPHLTPMIRGIHATLYAKCELPLDEIQAIYQTRYANEAFVNMLEAGQHPDTRNVKGSNHCQIALHTPGNSNTLVILSVIDNLVKGAAGQAVQNMNLMFNLTENQALEHIALYP